MGALVSILLSVGAPILAGILKSKGGKGGAIAGDVIEVVAERLGADATPQAIEEAYKADPEVFTQTVRTIETNYAAIARAGAEAHMAYIELANGDRNSADLLTRVWRPINGFLFPVGCLIIVVTVCVMLLSRISVDASVLPLIGIVVPVMTAWAGVVGYYVGQRTKEKTTGAT
ncbi:holin family protein [Hoeflea sp. WL0058]|uniref:Holin family protein n=1 Tax=Flavimaribacter sediminis TaxID=2865987 RepID=A0AAE2ZTA5_9HYPH|nr:3TM-type holin [Flavimaribacter sediminis]MBW8640471.1 holin family protein [Flavimaribacter sediminis]